jgi:hypothetical protein
MTDDTPSDPLNLLQTQAPKFVDGTADGYAILRRIYPAHVYDPLRRAIAVELAGKELGKILDAGSDKRLTAMQRAVADLYEGREGVYAPVHDFWSLVEMILHVKKKELPELITAANVDWTEAHLPLADLPLTWMPFLEQRPEVFGPKPWSIGDVQRIFRDDSELFAAAKREQADAANVQPHNFDQSDEPVTLVRRDGVLELVDGNGRLYRAVLAGLHESPCRIGDIHGEVPRDYWVSAGAIKQFCLEIRGYARIDMEAYTGGLVYLRAKLCNNRMARINYELFLRRDFPEFEDELSDVLSS